MTKTKSNYAKMIEHVAWVKERRERVFNSTTYAQKKANPNPAMRQLCRSII